MDHISSNTINKTQLKLSVQNEARQSLTILGESYRLKSLWKSDEQSVSCIEKVVIQNGNIYYQTKNTPGTIHNINKYGDIISVTEFYESSCLYAITIAYPESQFLTLGETIVKTEVEYKHFMVVEHFTKKIFFIASNKPFCEGGSLYAADIGKGAKEVVAKKVDIANKSKLTALGVDQLTGDIILAFHEIAVGYVNNASCFNIQSLQKISYLPQMMASAGVSLVKETEKNQDKIPGAKE